VVEEQDKSAELANLQARVTQLEAQVFVESAKRPFSPEGYYAGYYATTGFMLGIFGAMASLLFNVVGASLVGKHPLELIRTYLTFPLGDKAFELPPDQNGLMLAIGCCLYLGTGMALGVPVYMALTWWGQGRSLGVKFLIATAAALVIWLVNFYAILLWLQPALIDMSSENLIVNRVPWWVAAATHLVFAWTMVLVYPLGEFTPYRRPTEQR
jgi:hypothetical protein